MRTTGRHLLVDYHGCSTALLDDPDALAALMGRAAVAAGATVVETTMHRYAPQGVAGVVLLEESHLSVHTWPEHGYVAADLYTCGDCDPHRAHAVLEAGLGATRCELLEVQRGRPGPRSMGPPAD